MTKLYRQKSNKVASEAFWLLIGQVFVALGGLVSVKILTEIFPNDVYGVSWLFVNSVMLSSIVTGGVVGQAFGRFYHECKNEADLEVLLSTTLRVQTVVSLIIVAIYSILIVIIDYDINKYLIVYLVLPFYYFFMAFLSISVMIFNALRDRKKRVLLLILEAWFKPFFSYLFYVVWGPSVTSFVFGYFISTTLVSFVGLLWIKYMCAVAPHKLTMPSKDYTLNYVKYCSPLVIFSVISWILSLSDRYLVGWISGLTQAGIYVAAYQVGSALFQLLGGVFGPLVQPIIFQRGRKLGGDSLSSCYVAFAWISAPVLTVFIVTHQWILRWIVAKEYWGGGIAVFWVGMGTYLFVMGNIGKNVFHLNNQNGPLAKLTAVSSLANIAINLLLIPFYGINGAAFATFVSYGLYTLLIITYGRKILYWPFPWQTFTRVAIILSLSVTAGKFVHFYIFNGIYDFFSFTYVLLATILTFSFSVLLFKIQFKRDYNLLYNA